MGVVGYQELGLADVVARSAVMLTANFASGVRSCKDQHRESTTAGDCTGAAVRSGR